jgi:hypothetical protein
MPNNFILVAMDNHQAKIWNHGLDSGATHVTVDAKEALQEHDARSGEPKSNAAGTQFLEEISTHLVSAEAILLMGPGKGKASGVLHLRDFLEKKHANLAKKIYEIEHADIAHTSEKELLAHARDEWAKYRQTH